MRGTLIEKGPGHYELVVELGRDPLSGKRRRKSVTFRGAKRDAQRALAKMVGDDRRAAASVTVGFLLEAWLEQAELSPTTRREYERLVAQRIGPALGDVPLQKLRADRLDAFYRALMKPPPKPTQPVKGRAPGALSATSVHQVHAICHRALEQAVKWGWLETNPAGRTTPPKVRRKGIKPPTVAAVIALMRAAEETSADLGIAVRLGAGLGARRGEICALRWSDVDFDAGVIRIARSIAVGNGQLIEKETKTYAERELHVDDVTLKALLAHRDLCAGRAAEAGVELHRDGFVLSREPSGRVPWHPDTITGAWGRLCRQQGALVRFHDLRHWSVTTMLDAGVPVPVVAQHHGHRDGTVTLAIYGHPVDARRRLAADAIGRALDQ